MQALLLLILIPCLIIAAVPLFALFLTLITSKVFWIVLLLLIIFSFAYSYFDQKEKGYLYMISGYVTCKDVDSSKISRVILYPDRITINDIQTIPISRVQKAFTLTHDNSFVYRGHKIHRKSYSIVVNYKDKNGLDASFSCRTKDNPFEGGVFFEEMKRKINQLVGYKEVSKDELPTKPYEL
jgi:hypothetical protein